MRTQTQRREARDEVMQGVNDHDATLVEALMVGTLIFYQVPLDSLL